ncbi:MAG: hypothetical protein WC607_02595 [Candidatus Micrarchaeia archaeon]
MALNKLVFVLPLLFALSVSAWTWNSCSGVQYAESADTHSYHFLCIQGTSNPRHGTVLIPAYQSLTGYPEYKIVLDSLDASPGEHYLDASCYQAAGISRSGSRQSPAPAQWMSAGIYGGGAPSHWVKVAEVINLQIGAVTVSDWNQVCPYLKYVSWDSSSDVPSRAYVKISWTESTKRGR